MTGIISYRFDMDRMHSRVINLQPFTTGESVNRSEISLPLHVFSQATSSKNKESANESLLMHVKDTLGKA